MERKAEVKHTLYYCAQCKSSPSSIIAKVNKYKQPDSNAPPHIDKLCKQAVQRGKRTSKLLFFFVLAVGINRFLI